MRNLKKLFAVVMIVAMLASIMVPAFAADYENEAQTLKSLGLFKGYSDTDLGLGDALTREQGLTFMIRARGLEAEVEAMSAEEIAAQLANVTDLETVTDWAKPYVAYAVKNGLTKGIDKSINPKVKFAGQLLLTGKEFINFMLNAMGYEEAWDNVLTKAAEIGMLTAGQAVQFGSITELKRDTAAGIISFAMSGITASGVTLAQALVDAGAVTAEAMAEAGYLEPTVAPTEAPKTVEITASTDNLIQIYVEYGAKVDAASAKSKDNYKLSSGEIDTIALLDDGATAVITLKAAKKQQDTVSLTIKNVKLADGSAINETKIEGIEFFDITPPSIVNVEIAGKDTFKVTFSEPMVASDKANFVVNDGKLYVKEVTRQNNNTEMLVKMYSSFAEGDIKILVKNGNEDFAGFGVKAEAFTLDVVKDTEAPVIIGYEDASLYGVTLIWNEDITFIGSKVLTDYYHTNGSNFCSDVTIDGNKMTLVFDKADKRLLPPETAYIYVLKDSVKDLWDNKNAQQMVKIDVEVDETAPEVSGDIKVKTEQQIEITVNEVLDDTTVKAKNFTILDSDGKEVKDIISSVSYASKKITVNFTKKLTGDYSIVIKGVADLTGNEMDVTVPFVVTDKTAPVPSDFSAKIYNIGVKGQMLKISFKEAMSVDGKYAVNDIEKYFIEEADGTVIYLEDIDDVKIEAVDSNKAVEITIPDDEYDLTKMDKLWMTRVADAAGNYTELTLFEVSFQTATTVGYDAKFTATDTVVLTFEDEISFEIEDFVIGYAVGADVYSFEIASVTTELKDNKTVATIKVEKSVAGKYTIGYSFNDGDFKVNVIDDESANKYGQNVTPGKKNIADKIAPAVKKDGIVFGTTNGAITITFEEAIATTNAALYAHDLVVTNGKDTLTPVTDYNTEVSGSTIKITFTKAGLTDVSDYTVKTRDSIAYIKGVDGNKIAAFDSTK